MSEPNIGHEAYRRMTEAYGAAKFTGPQAQPTPAIGAMKTLFIVQRGEAAWTGALLIAADTPEEAEKLFVEYEDADGEKPFKVLTCNREVSGASGVIYNDDLR